MINRLLVGAAASTSLLSIGCDFDSELAPRTYLPVTVDGSELRAIETDLGYRVDFEICRVALADVEFTSQGQMHATLFGGLYEALVPTAHAHPGHNAGGEVVGELLGRFVFDWRGDNGVSIGEAELLHADYTGANFTFVRAEAGDGLATDDPLVGHTMQLAGVAHRGDQVWSFDAVLDQDEGRRIIGAPFGAEVDDQTAGALGLRMFTRDPVEQDTLLDGIDFGQLDSDGDGHVEIAHGTDGWNTLRRATQDHDYFEIAAP